MGKIYVGNLSWGTTEDELKALFEQHGEVKTASIILDKESGRSRGFGFVEMDNSQEAINALNGKDFQGRTLTVNEAQDRRRSPAGGGFGYNRR